MKFRYYEICAPRVGPDYDMWNPRVDYIVPRVLRIIGAISPAQGIYLLSRWIEGLARGRKFHRYFRNGGK